MASRLVKTEFDRTMLIRYLEKRELPFTVEVARKRTTDQNKLQRKWLTEIAEQSDGNTAEEVRGWCKLHIGVPILREENEEFREKYDRIVKPMSYEDKLELMMVPFDFPITRLMTTAQKSLYLDRVFARFSGLGLVLTDPNAGGRLEAAA
jgi:hypothetical protein